MSGKDPNVHCTRCPAILAIPLFLYVLEWIKTELNSPQDATPKLTKVLDYAIFWVDKFWTLSFPRVASSELFFFSILAHREIRGWQE